MRGIQAPIPTLTVAELASIDEKICNELDRDMDPFYNIL